ncbi:ankyrin repeat and fibronectin type-III domain-containing protein 1-like isoform X3 [Watersipora subatra]
MTSSIDNGLAKSPLTLRTSSLRRSFVNSPSSLDVSQLPTYSLDASMRRKNYVHKRSRSYDTSIPDLTTLTLYKTEKKKSFESLLEYDYTAAVFEAVQQDNLEELEAIVDVRSEAVNDLNGDGMSVLDVALLLNSRSITEYLLEHAAQVQLLAPKDDSSTVMTELDRLICDCEQAIATLSGTIMAMNSKYKVREKKLNVWLNKRKVLKKMKAIYSQSVQPPPPEKVKLSITGQTSLKVMFESPHIDLCQDGSTPIIGYKVEWSCCDTFPSELTDKEFLSTSKLHKDYELTGLLEGVLYHIRVSVCNMKGYGESKYPEPKSAVPSSWCDCPTIEGQSKVYDAQRVRELYNEVRAYRNLDDSSSTSSFADQTISKSSSIKKGLKGLFSSQSSKFSKSLKRGLYLACVFWHEEKILVTEEEKCLPMIEVDDAYSPNNLLTDFSWLLKVCCHWTDVRQLKEDMERLSSVTSYSFRQRLITAATQLQILLGVSDLGMLHYTHIRDPHTGAVVFPLVKRVDDPKQLAGLQNVKWCSTLKLQRHGTSINCLVNSIPEMILYRQVCDTPIPSGLYLGYLQTTVHNSSINVYTAQLNPNTLPMIKIRDNSHVTKPEWQSLLELSPSYQKEKDSIETESSSKSLFKFHSQISRAFRRLVESLDMAADTMLDLRLYDQEVLEFSPSISMIVLLPPRNYVCSMKSSPSQMESITCLPDLLAIPVKIFEISHLYTYQVDFIKAYTRAMVLIDMEFNAAVQAHREAFTNAEIEASKQQVENLRAFQRGLEEMWGRARWVTDIISVAREKNYSGIPMRQLYQSVIEKHEQRCRDDQSVESAYRSSRRVAASPSSNLITQRSRDI